MLIHLFNKITCGLNCQRAAADQVSSSIPVTTTGQQHTKVDQPQTVNPRETNPHNRLKAVNKTVLPKDSITHINEKVRAKNNKPDFLLFIFKHKAFFIEKPSRMASLYKRNFYIDDSPSPKPEAYQWRENYSLSYEGIKAKQHGPKKGNYFQIYNNNIKDKTIYRIYINPKRENSENIMAYLAKTIVTNEDYSISGAKIGGKNIIGRCADAIVLYLCDSKKIQPIIDDIQAQFSKEYFINEVPGGAVPFAYGIGVAPELNDYKGFGETLSDTILKHIHLTEYYLFHEAVNNSISKTYQEYTKDPNAVYLVP